MPTDDGRAGAPQLRAQATAAPGGAPARDGQGSRSPPCHQGDREEGGREERPGRAGPDPSCAAGEAALHGRGARTLNLPHATAGGPNGGNACAPAPPRPAPDAALTRSPPLPASISRLGRGGRLGGKMKAAAMLGASGRLRCGVC